jgi:hypothetical protein
VNAKAVALSRPAVNLLKPLGVEAAMAEQNRTDRSESDAALEREIRRGRKFSLNEALGRMGGQGMLKGGSPVPPQQQAEFEIGLYLRDHLSDASGVLPVVVLRRVKQSELFLHNRNEPLHVLSDYVGRLLQSPDLLKELVREADMEWGQVIGERPYFQQEGHASSPDDPYTFESVRADLSRLLESLRSDTV